MNKVNKFLLKVIKENNLYVNFREYLKIYENIRLVCLNSIFINQIEHFLYDNNFIDINNKFIKLIDRRQYNTYFKNFPIEVKISSKKEMIHFGKYLDDNGITWLSHDKFSSLIPKYFFSSDNCKVNIIISNFGECTYDTCIVRNTKMYTSFSDCSQFINYFEKLKQDLNNNFEKFLKK